MKKAEELVSLKGKTSLITGAASGIGKAISMRFAEAGADLVLVDIQNNKLQILKEELKEFKVKVKTYKVDISKKKEIDKLWTRLEGREPDILVNNAGIYPFKKFTEVDEDFYNNVMNINLNSMVWMCHQMISRRIKSGGTIINTGSIEALLPFKKDLAPYSVSKAGVLALTRSLANEYGSKGFKINGIIPGGIVTPGTKSAAKGLLKFKFGLFKTAKDFTNRLSLGRLGEPDEVARVALFLASDLSSYMSGALVAVDGGFLSA